VDNYTYYLSNLTDTRSKILHEHFAISSTIIGNKMPLVDEGILTDMVLEPKAKISALSAQLNSLEESTRKAEPKLRSVLYKSLDDGEKCELNSIATTLYYIP